MGEGDRQEEWEEKMDRSSWWAAMGMCTEGMGPLDYSVGPEHSSRLIFQVRKPGFLKCGSIFQIVLGATRILGHGVRYLKGC